MKDDKIEFIIDDSIKEMLTTKEDEDRFFSSILEMPLLQEVLNPTSFPYELSEDLFLDLWSEFGRREYLIDPKEINEFLMRLIELSKKSVNLDQFSLANYDNIIRIEYEKPYTKLYWKDLNDFREMYLEGNLDEFDRQTWEAFGYGTYLYTLTHISKLKFIQEGNHLFVLILSNLIPVKDVKKAIIKSNCELIDEEVNKTDFYREYSFWEGNKEDCKKHICIVNNLPYYSCLIQSKQGVSISGKSKKIMLFETVNEALQRMKKTYAILETLDKFDYDQIFAQGNTVRRILEYTLKLYCIFKEIELEIDTKYGHVNLGKLKSEINKSQEHIIIEQSLINTANELSHDSGEVFSKDEVIEFWNDAKKLLVQIHKEING
ncbi:hypothetical protein EYB33_12970 [Lysinibacillus sphaericus]|uniref:hypothetical protein n=1 Tax=Lysinibacillus sphaericus TaxID=1421 RepID=UPI001E64E2AC|nr:hypothetical protein [Lysinibacillus sphaericus]UDK97155.1 hypothetical protein EYB33_12970 [Lysinibacillus sphaericus]